MKSILSLLLLPALLFLVGCTGGEEGETTNDWPDPPEEIKAYMPIDLTPQGLPILLWIPDSTVGQPKVVVQPYGETEVRVGKYFQISIAMGGDMNLKKTDLAEDLLYKSEFVEETPDAILYKSALPDGSQEFAHFYVVKNINGTSYEIQDIVEGDSYPQIAIKRMMESAKFIQPAAKPAPAEGEES